MSSELASVYVESTDGRTVGYVSVTIEHLDSGYNETLDGSTSHYNFFIPEFGEYRVRVDDLYSDASNETTISFTDESDGVPIHVDFPSLIHVTVENGSGAPLRGRTVSIDGPGNDDAIKTTGSDGTVAISPSETGTYHVNASFGSGIRDTATVNVSDRGDRTDVVLQTPPPTLEFTSNTTYLDRRLTESPTDLTVQASGINISQVRIQSRQGGSDWGTLIRESCGTLNCTLNTTVHRKSGQKMYYQAVVETEDGISRRSGIIRINWSYNVESTEDASGSGDHEPGTSTRTQISTTVTEETERLPWLVGVVSLSGALVVVLLLRTTRWFSSPNKAEPGSPPQVTSPNKNQEKEQTDLHASMSSEDSPITCPNCGTEFDSSAASVGDRCGACGDGYLTRAGDRVVLDDGE
ncbi:hypothetical protein GOC74_17180 [Halomicrobium mukohataei]|uniref:Carboxypeptidase regulatory-like domain-containing protein n=1 Tax=Halomicrobium mukohataei TaxID=57705 RepID=A0A847UHC9_9EURY|nr:hypothetical protein [Halomicrobium mukohataei]NLV11657.1 hypothetical protein [Halomicrobium mukohataei]